MISTWPPLLVTVKQPFAVIFIAVLVKTVLLASYDSPGSVSKSQCLFCFSAKVLVKGEPNVSYICSRYYRAPELIFGATDYTPDIG